MATEVPHASITAVENSPEAFVWTTANFERVGADNARLVFADLADAFFGLLTPQDSNKPRLHITVQNKVERSVARKLLQMLESDFSPRPLSIVGLEAHYYRGGPWEPIQAWKFRG